MIVVSMADATASERTESNKQQARQGRLRLLTDYVETEIRGHNRGLTEAAATATTMIRFYQCWILCSAAHAKVKGRTGRGVGGQLFNSSNSKID